MKKIILMILVILGLATTNAFAGVYAEIIDIVQDDSRGSIIVRTQYKIDGIEVISRYPKLNGKYYHVTRYHINSFAGMTDPQARDYILADLTAHAKNLVKTTYLRKANFVFIQDKANLIIGTNGTVNQTSILVDTDADNILDTEWIVKTDGTRTEQPYVVP